MISPLTYIRRAFFHYKSLTHTSPMMQEGWWELSDPEEPRGCLQQSVCQANAVLARDYGGAGRVIATLIR